MNLLQQANNKGIQGFLHCAELDKLAELAAGKDVLEIGAYCGLSAWGMAQTAKSVTSVDTFKATTDGQRQVESLQTLDDYKRATAECLNVSHHVGSSEECAALPEMRDYLWDMIFIDAGHTYEDVKADIERWWPRVRSGGLIAFHDCPHQDYPGVVRAVEEFFGLGDEQNQCFGLRWILKP